MKHTTRMLILLSLFSMFRCKTSPAAVTGSHESEADRIAAFQQYPDALYPVKVRDKWGYINRKGEMVISPVFEEADDFNDGLAKAGKRDGDQSGIGFIDAKGNWIVKPVYQSAGIYSNGLAAVSKDQLYGYADAEGTEVIPCQFEDAGDFHNGYAAVKQGGWTGFIDKTGSIVIKPAYTVSVGHTRFNEGLAPVFGADEQTGFIDTSGQWAISAQFQSAGNFADGLAWAMWEQDDAAAEHGISIKGGFIDREGVYVIPPEYDFGWDFSEGYATVWVRSDDKLNKIWKVIDRQGNVVLDNPPYRNVGAMHNGLIPIQNEDMKWGFMNSIGEEVIAPMYTGVNHFNNGMARMEVGTAYDQSLVYINPKGEVVWDAN